MDDLRLIDETGEVDARVALAAALRGPGAVVVSGVEGGGRTQALDLAADVVPEKIALRVDVSGSEPQQAALLQLAAGLVEHGESSLRQVDEPGRPWREKVDATGEALRRVNGSAVVLIDGGDLLFSGAPNVFGQSSDAEGDGARQALVDMLRAAGRATSVVWAASHLPAVATLQPRQLRLAGVSAGSSAPIDPPQWDLLVLACARRPRWLKLARALLAWRTPHEVLVLAVEGDQQGSPRPLVEAWMASADLAPVVRELPHRFNDVIWSSVTERSLDDLQVLVDAGIVDRGVSGLRVPLVVQRVAGGGARPEDRELAARFGRACADEWDRLGFSADGVRFRLAAADRFSDAADVDGLVRVTRGFATPLVQLGRALGTRGRDAERSGDFDRARALFAEAARAYDRALDLEPGRAYALHYRGYNRARAQRLGATDYDSARIESDLREAADAADHHPWYWQRLVLFHLHRADLAEAREVLSEAVHRVARADQREQLFAPILRTLRSSGHIEAAFEVAELALNETPSAPCPAFDEEVARTLSARGHRAAACRYLASRLNALPEPPAHLKALLATLYEADGLTVEAARWSDDASGDVAGWVSPRSGHAGDAHTVMRDLVARSDLGAWVLLRDNQLVESADSVDDLVALVPLAERHLYLVTRRPAPAIDRG